MEELEEKSLYRILDEHRMVIDTFEDSFAGLTLNEEQQNF